MIIYQGHSIQGFYRTIIYKLCKVLARNWKIKILKVHFQSYKKAYNPPE